MKSQYHEFDSLVSKVLDGSVNESEFSELNKLLLSNTDLQHRYCSFIRNESIFHWENESTIIEGDSKVIEISYFPIIASVAAVVVCIASAWFMHANFYTEYAYASGQVNPKQIGEVPTTIVSSKESEFSKIVSQNFDMQVPFENLNAKAGRLLNFFETKQIITEEGELSFDGRLPFLKVDDFLNTAGKSGVLPMTDGKMLQFSEMIVDTVNQVAQVTETLRVYNMANANLSAKSNVDASIHFNQSQSSLSESTEFSLSLSAVEAVENGIFHEISSAEQMIYGDNDQTTWEKVDTSFSIPGGTQYLVVSLKAKKHGPSALTANSHDFFADELEISFVGI
mgnify:CR=1 FL=1